MSTVTAATLIPLIGMIALDGDYRALLSIGLALAGAVLAEVFMTLPFGKTMPRDGTVLISGLLTGFLLPTSLSPAVVFSVSLTGTLFARAVFGGTGSYWIHPTAVSVAIAFISVPTLFPPQLVTAEGMDAVGDAFASLKVDSFPRLVNDKSMTDAFNGLLTQSLGIRIPEGYVTLLWKSPSAIPAFRYNALILVSSIVMLSLKVIDWIVPVFFLLCYSALIRLLPLMPFAPDVRQGDILFALLTSGTLFIAFYVLPEFSTTPRSRVGKALFGCVAGSAAFLICGPGGSAGGGAFAVLAANAFSPLFEFLERRPSHPLGEQS